MTSPESHTTRRYLGIGLRVFIALVALTWTATQVEYGSLLTAVSRVSIVAFLSALAWCFLGIFLASIRWRLLLIAYGASHVPRLAFLFRVYLVGIFYNTFLPANVGGDLVRGHVTRRSFVGAASAFLIVAIERLFGLAGLMLLAATVLLIRPIETDLDLRLVGIAGVAAAVLAVAAPFVGRSLSRWIPGRAGETLAVLPRVSRPMFLSLVLCLSVATQLCVAVAGHSLMASISSGVLLTDSLVLVPLAMASLYLPTVAGIGVREAAFVFFFGLVGVGAANATAASLAFFASQLILAASGGVIHAVTPQNQPLDQEQ